MWLLIIPWLARLNGSLPNDNHGYYTFLQELVQPKVKDCSPRHNKLRAQKKFRLAEQRVYFLGYLKKKLTHFHHCKRLCCKNVQIFSVFGSFFCANFFSFWISFWIILSEMAYCLFCSSQKFWSMTEIRSSRAKLLLARAHRGTASSRKKLFGEFKVANAQCSSLFMLVY